MAKKYSVIYDPVAKVPFGIIQEANGAKLAHPVHVSANHWATRYNGGEKVVPHGMTSTDFVEMDCDFIESFKSAFGTTGRDRVSLKSTMPTFRGGVALIAASTLGGSTFGG